jgi:hypothetical protein
MNTTVAESGTDPHGPGEEVPGTDAAEPGGHPEPTTVLDIMARIFKAF